MKENLSLLYMGKALMGDQILRESLRRQAETLGWCVTEERMLPLLEPDTPLEFRRELERAGRYLIVAEEESFALAGRILSTLSDRALILSEAGVLAPSGAFDIGEGSYTLRIGEATITVLKRSREHPYPSLPLEERGGYTWHCFPRSGDEEKRLLKLLSLKGEESTECTRLVPGWLRIRACGEENIAPVQELLEHQSIRYIPRPTLVRAFIDYFSTMGKTLTFAESCTGGRLAEVITSESGSSAILEGSYVTYANGITLWSRQCRVRPGDGSRCSVQSRCGHRRGDQRYRGADGSGAGQTGGNQRRPGAGGSARSENDSRKRRENFRLFFEKLLTPWNFWAIILPT